MNSRAFFTLVPFFALGLAACSSATPAPSSGKSGNSAVTTSDPPVDPAQIAHEKTELVGTFDVTNPDDGNNDYAPPFTEITFNADGTFSTKDDASLSSLGGGDDPESGTWNIDDKDTLVFTVNGKSNETYPLYVDGPDSFSIEGFHVTAKFARKK